VADVATPIVQREVFGPVATFEVFDDEADAIGRANATEYGLAAGVWSCGVDRPLRVGRELEAGTVWSNTCAVVVDQMEEGGFKQSGVGRLNGNGHWPSSRRSSTPCTRRRPAERARRRPA
jgi:betaine-aldehyde dehydrogenase